MVLGVDGIVAGLYYGISKHPCATPTYSLRQICSKNENKMKQIWGRNWKMKRREKKRNIMENHYNCRQAALCGIKEHCLIRALNVFKFITVLVYKMFCC